MEATTLAALILEERNCDATGDIPTTAWPLLSQSKAAIIAVGGTGVTLQFDADRELLWADLSMRVIDRVTGAVVGATVDVDYCDNDLLVGVDVSEFRYCCAGKPWFVAGMRESKTLNFIVTLAAAAGANGVYVEVSLNGIQGKGCCPE